MEIRAKLLLLSILWREIQANPFEITPLDPRKGIMLEPLGIGITYEKTWTVITSIDLPNWHPVLEYLQYCDDTLLEVCSLRGENAEARCKYWHTIIKRDIADVKEQVAELRGFSSHSRKRRGLVDVVGQVSKFLFGTMDHEDSVEIYKRIQQLEEDNTENLQLISKQMTLIKSNFNAVLAPINAIQKEHEELKKMVSDFVTEYTQNIHKLEKEVKYVKLQGETGEITLAVLTHMQYTQKTLTHLFTLLNALHQHRLHPLLLRADTLENLYRNLTTSVPMNDHLKDPVVLNEIITVENLLLKDRILIKIAIPIGKESSYSTEKVYKYPIPTEHGNYGLLTTKTDYLLVNNRTQTIKQFTKEKFQQRCTPLRLYTRERLYLCKEEDPLPVGIQTQNPCLHRLIFTDNNNQTPKCPAQSLAYHPNLLTKMNTPNHWLFSYETKQLLQSNCKNGTQQVTIEGTGILRINPQCTHTLGPWELPGETSEVLRLPVKTSDMIIPQLTFNIQPMANISTKVKLLEVSTNLQKEGMEQAAQETSELANQIHRIETQRVQRQQNQHSWVALGLSSVSTISVILLIGYICLRILKQRRPQVKEGEIPRILTISAPINSEPAPRSETIIAPVHITTTRNKVPQSTTEKQVTFRDSNYEAPLESAPAPPEPFRRAPSLRIPRHAIR